MDHKIQAVLDIYHERIAQEKSNRRNAVANGINTQTEEFRNSQLLAVGPETGQLLNILARSFEAPNILEIGTSYGYSGIWLADAARASGGRVTTLELHDFKSAHAKEMSTRAGLADHVDFKVGDAVQLIAELPFNFDFILLDLWKNLYVPCLEAFYPKLNPGAIIVADNIVRGSSEGIDAYVKAIRSKPDVQSVLLPVGSGIEISRYKAD